MRTKKLVVVFDGGGTRGKFHCFMLDEIQKHIGMSIASISDLTVGVSAGAAIASLLTDKAKSTLNFCTCITMVDMAFSDATKYGPWLQPKYSGVAKRTGLKEIFGSKTFGDCQGQLLILASTIDGEPMLYSNDQHPDLKLVDIIDGSTAAPGYFPPVQVGDTTLIDGGIITNTPVLIAIDHARTLWGNEVELYVLSFGTGHNVMRKIIERADYNSYGLLHWLKDGLLDVMHRGQSHILEKRLKEVLPVGNYLRITCGVNCPLDDTSPQVHQALQRDAIQIWRRNEALILQWLKPFISESP